MYALYLGLIGMSREIYKLNDYSVSIFTISPICLLNTMKGNGIIN